jgi:hypothetical protein
MYKWSIDRVTKSNPVCSHSNTNRRFGGIYRLHLQGRKIRERGTSVSRWLQTGATSQKTAFFIVTAVKTSNLTFLCIITKLSSAHLSLPTSFSLTTHGRRKVVKAKFVQLGEKALQTLLSLLFHAWDWVHAYFVPFIYFRIKSLEQQPSARDGTDTR